MAPAKKEQSESSDDINPELANPTGQVCSTCHQRKPKGQSYVAMKDRVSHNCSNIKCIGDCFPNDLDQRHKRHPDLDPKKQKVKELEKLQNDRYSSSMAKLLSSIPRKGQVNVNTVKNAVKRDANYFSLTPKSDLSYTPSSIDTPAVVASPSLTVHKPTITDPQSNPVNASVPSTDVTTSPVILSPTNSVNVSVPSTVVLPIAANANIPIRIAVTPKEHDSQIELITSKITEMEEKKTRLLKRKALVEDLVNGLYCDVDEQLEYLQPVHYQYIREERLRKKVSDPNQSN